MKLEIQPLTVRKIRGKNRWRCSSIGMQLTRWYTADSPHEAVENAMHALRAAMLERVARRYGPHPPRRLQLPTIAEPDPARVAAGASSVA